MSAFMELIVAFIYGVKCPIKDPEPAFPIFSGAFWAMFHITDNQSFVRELVLTHCFPCDVT
jgi:hypothetical protein